MSRATPSLHQFAFQDPFAPLGTMATTFDPASASNSNSASASESSNPSNLSGHPDPKSTSPNYHYSPTAEPRRMSEISASGWASTSPMNNVNGTDYEYGMPRSRGESVITITPLSSQTPIAHFSPPLSTASTFNSRASMSAIEQDQLFTFGSGSGSGPGATPGAGPGYVGESPKGMSMTLPAIRPRMLRYKTSPARFTGLGLDIVVKAQPVNLESSTLSSGTISGTGAGSTTYTATNATANASERRKSSQRSLDSYSISGSASGVGGGDRRRSSQKSSTTTTTTTTTTTLTDDPDRRRSSGTSASSMERKGGGGGVWAVVDVVDTLSTTELTFPPSNHHPHTHNQTSMALGTGAPRRGSVYTVEHVSSRSTTITTATTGTSGSTTGPFNSLPSRNGKNRGPPPVSNSGFAFNTILSPSDGFSIDPLTFPRRGSLAVLSQTALGPWAATSTAAVVAGTAMGTGTGTGVGISGEPLLGAPKGDWQERRGSWAEGWSKK